MFRRVFLFWETAAEKVRRETEAAGEELPQCLRYSLDACSRSEVMCRVWKDHMQKYKVDRDVGKRLPINSIKPKHPKHKSIDTDLFFHRKGRIDLLPR
jgi:hypothetical protein